MFDFTFVLLFFNFIVDEREERILLAEKEPSQIMQEVVKLAAATSSSGYVILFPCKEGLMKQDLTAAE